MQKVKIAFVGSSFLGESGLRWLLDNEESLGIRIVGVIGRDSSKTSDDFCDLTETISDVRPDIPSISLRSHEQSRSITEAFEKWEPELSLCIG